MFEPSLSILVFQESVSLYSENVYTNVMYDENAYMIVQGTE